MANVIIKVSTTRSSRPVRKLARAVAAFSAANGWADCFSITIVKRRDDDAHFACYTALLVRAGMGIRCDLVPCTAVFQ